MYSDFVHVHPFTNIFLITERQNKKEYAMGLIKYELYEIQVGAKMMVWPIPTVSNEELYPQHILVGKSVNLLL